MRRYLGWLILGSCACFVLGDCAASPRQRPLQTDPVSEGPGTIEAARKALEGRWTLVSLEVAAADGRRASVEASGLLTSDAFGNMSIEYRLSEAGQKALAELGVTSPNPVISTTGQVAIDTQQRRITYVAPDSQARPFDPDLAARRANPFALERPRYYQLAADGVLTLTTRHDNGQDAATSRWKK
jgi:hypothetical protein